MNETNPVATDPDHHHRLQQQIHCLTERLREVGDSGDCAYEKALVRVYRTLLAQYRDQAQ